MHTSIVKSSNVYYYSLANEMGVDLMYEQLTPFGFGVKTGIDVEGEVTGILPSTAWKKRYYKKPEHQKWYAGETISLGIGQGYNNFTMLQLASATATLANNGGRMKPHLVKEVKDVVTQAVRPAVQQNTGQLAAKPENIAVIRNALVGVNIEGTSARAFQGAGYTSGGKTGTAQVIAIKANEKYNAALIDERHRDHALYMAYAPAEDPKIALAMVVENAGFGAQNAAPIARRIFDYWLMALYPNEQDIAAVRKGQASAPLGKPRPAAEVDWPPGTATAVPLAAASAPATPMAAASAARAPASAIANVKASRP
jgi:penicillin-binding protein 2